MAMNILKNFQLMKIKKHSKYKERKQQSENLNMLQKDFGGNLGKNIELPIDEEINYRDEFDISDEEKELSTLKNNRRNDRTSITNISMTL